MTNPPLPVALVADLWIRPAVVLGPDTTLAETARELRVRDVSSAVVGVPGAPVAVVTERDLTRALAERRSPDEPVGDVATPDPVTVDPGTDVLAAATTMLRHGLRHLVVARERRVIGIVSMRDVLAALVTRSTDDTVLVRLDRRSVVTAEVGSDRRR